MRACRPPVVEAPSRLRLLRRLRAAWLAFRVAGRDSYGDAAWSSDDFLASLREDGVLELVYVHGCEFEVLLHAGGKRHVEPMPRSRPRPPRRHILVH